MILVLVLVLVLRVLLMIFPVVLVGILLLALWHSLLSAPALGLPVSVSGF
jgi:hypothetical protein